jgi:hypothetical protein
VVCGGPDAAGVLRAGEESCPALAPVRLRFPSAYPRCPADVQTRVVSVRNLTQMDLRFQWRRDPWLAPPLHPSNRPSSKGAPPHPPARAPARAVHPCGGLGRLPPCLCAHAVVRACVRV